MNERLVKDAAEAYRKVQFYKEMVEQWTKLVDHMVALMTPDEVRAYMSVTESKETEK